MLMSLPIFIWNTDANLMFRGWEGARLEKGGLIEGQR